MSADVGDLQTFLDSSPSAFHVAATVATRLLAAGFTNWVANDDGTEMPDDGFVVRDGALIAWRNGTSVAPTAAFLLTGGHTDSPGFRVKPNPDAVRFGWKQLNVEVYGGILNNSWLDRDLGIAGRVTAVDGTHTLVNVDRPIARIPQLAVHLDRTVNEALTLDRQTHLRPVWGVAGDQTGTFVQWLSTEAQLQHAPAFWDLCLYDVQPSAVLGADHRCWHRDVSTTNSPVGRPQLR